MTIPTLEPGLFAFLFLALAAPLLGLVGLLAPASLRPRRWAAAAAAGLAVAAAAAACAGGSQSYWAPPAILAGLCGASFAFSSPRLAGAAAALLCGPRLHAAALVAVGPALAAGWAWCAFPAVPGWVSSPGLHLAHAQVRLAPDLSCRPVTDAGRPVSVYHPADPTPTTDQLWEMDADVIAARRLDAKLIRTGGPGEECNCHGWVFTGGRGWVRGEDVDAILMDNGYYAVDAPRANDVIVYRDAAGRVTHSGIVQAVTLRGMVLVESKWGRGGRFLHAPGTPPYGTFTYYHSARRGSRLRGLDGAATSPAPAVEIQ